MIKRSKAGSKARGGRRLLGRMAASATHGARYSIGSTIQPGTNASDDSCELLCQTICSTSGLNFSAEVERVLKFIRAKLA